MLNILRIILALLYVGSLQAENKLVTSSKNRQGKFLINKVRGLYYFLRPSDFSLADPDIKPQTYIVERKPIIYKWLQKNYQNFLKTKFQLAGKKSLIT